MLEEMRVLAKNQTWKLVALLVGKQTVGYKWVCTVKQTPEDEVDHYKARLVVEGYTQTYGTYYDETFTPVAKINIVRTLIFCAANLSWSLF